MHVHTPFKDVLRLILSNFDLICATPFVSSLTCVFGSGELSEKCMCTRNVTALGVLCCFALFVCLTLLASFFLIISLYH